MAATPPPNLTAGQTVRTPYGPVLILGVHTVDDTTWYVWTRAERLTVARSVRCTADWATITEHWTPEQETP